MFPRLSAKWKLNDIAMPSTSALNWFRSVASAMRSQFAADRSSRFRCAFAWLKATWLSL